MSVDNVKPGDLPEELPGGADARAVAALVRAADGPGPGRYKRFRCALDGHVPFACAAALAAFLRIVVMLGYPSAMFFPDSYNYLADALTGMPDNTRGNGYPFLLRLLMPLHSFSVVTGLQALMGLGMAALIYAVLRRRGLPGWGATLCSLPVLFDAYELAMEHIVSSDVLFCTLVTVAVTLLCFWDTPPWGVLVLAGVIVGYAAAVRNIGEAMLVLVVVGLLARRLGWKRIVAVAAAGVVPIAGYMIWYHSFTGQYAMNEAGPFLYGRVQTFADCSRMDPPPDLRALCDPRSTARREFSQAYLWAPDQPLMKLSGGQNQYEFTPRNSKLSKRFAELAIESQPLSYAKTVIKDTLTTFDWNRVDADNSTGNLMGTGGLYQFSPHPGGLPWWITPSTPHARAARQFGGADYGVTRVRQPWATFLGRYQRVFLRGPVLLVIILIGAAGVVAGMRRRAWKDRHWGGIGLLPWIVGASLIVLPPMTAGFSYRYLLAAVPSLCLAAGLACAGPGGLVTSLKRRLGKSAEMVKEG